MRRVNIYDVDGVYAKHPTEDKFAFERHFESYVVEKADLHDVPHAIEIIAPRKIWMSLVYFKTDSVFKTITEQSEWLQAQDGMFALAKYEICNNFKQSGFIKVEIRFSSLEIATLFKLRFG